ncbi:class I SAM-dependent methyltransferase [Parvibaculum sp.]|uniref:class I SAM-dependent methyltransferase n=1 Tax=Parvibaculum sp. TaxID=2024848 RepID=UPI0038B3F493
MKSIARQRRPEMNAGGFSRYAGVIQFFVRVQSLVRPDMEVLDFGAGRGAFLEDPNNFRRDLRTLKGKVKKVVGVDVDEAIFLNTGVDETHRISPGVEMPFPPDSFDLVLSEWVLEHLDDPAFFAHEMERVIRPGGWLCARTPNKWGLTAIAARLVPNSRHVAFLKLINASRQERDVFPTRYKLNTLGQLRRAFPPDKWEHCSYLWRGEPKYHGNNLALYRLMEGWNALVPPFMATDVFVFLKKKELPDTAS